MSDRNMVMQRPSAPVAADPTAALYDVLRAAKLDFFVSVPCKLLSDLIDRLATDQAVFHSPVSREEEGLGIAFGAGLAGKRPAIVMQNSGLGNSINAIMALVNYYAMPMTFIVSHRGSDGEPIEAQRMMGGITQSLFDLVGIRHATAGAVSDLPLVADALRESALAASSLAILLPFSYWRVAK